MSRLVLAVLIIVATAFAKGAEDYVARGNQHIEKKQYEKAMQEFDHAIAEDGGSLEAWRGRTACLIALSRVEEAISGIDTMIARAYSSTDKLLKHKASLLEGSDRYAETIDVYEELIRHNPQDRELYQSKAINLSVLGRYEGAIKELDKALEIKPDYFDALYFKGLLLSNLELYEEALAALDAALTIKPKNSEAICSKGACLGGLGRYEESLMALDAALKINPDDNNAFFCKACTYSRMKDKASMLTNLEKAIELEPSWRDNAKEDPDFEFYRDDEDFRKLVGLE